MPGAEIPSRAARPLTPMSRALSDRDEERDLPAGDAERVDLAPQVAVELQQHGPEPVRHRYGIGNHINH